MTLETGIFSPEAQHESELDEIRHLILKQYDDAVFDLKALQTMDDEGGCQFWLQRQPPPTQPPDATEGNCDA